jgi:dienelactone hydrolase
MKRSGVVLVGVTASCALCAVVVSVLAACGSGDSAPATTPDAAVDAAVEAAIQGGGEAGADAGVDASYCGLSVPANAIVFPAPTGTFGVSRGGRRTIVDSSRTADPTAPPDLDAGADGGDAGPLAGPRQLAIEIWYPTDACPPGPRAPYLDKDEAASYGFTADPTFYQRVQLHAVANGAFTSDGAKHPVLLFSPGYAALPRGYAQLIEDVVSHGFVVVAISEAYFSGLTVLADGTEIAGTHQRMAATGQSESDVWLADSRVVLDEVEKLNATDPLGEVVGRLDLDHVGMYGHSFGGGAALNMLATDTRVKAAASLDGVLFNPAASSTLTQPFMLFRSEMLLDVATKEMVSRATASVFTMQLAGSTEGAFVDFDNILVQEGMPNPTAFGAIDPNRAIAAINAYDIAFFETYLAGKSSPLLDAASPAFPEIQNFAKQP